MVVAVFLGDNRMSTNSHDTQTTTPTTPMPDRRPLSRRLTEWIGHANGIVIIVATLVTMAISLAQFYADDPESSTPDSPYESEWTPPAAPAVLPTQIKGVATTDLCVKMGATCSATASFQPLGEHWEVCDTKVDGYGVRLYIKVNGQGDRVIGAWSEDLEHCPKLNDEIPDETAVLYRLCLTRGQEDVAGCKETTDWA